MKADNSKIYYLETISGCKVLPTDRTQLDVYAVIVDEYPNWRLAYFYAGTLLPLADFNDYTLPNCEGTSPTELHEKFMASLQFSGAKLLLGAAPSFIVITA